MSIYKEERPPRDGRKITFPDSNEFIIEAMGPGDHIFDETEEIRALRWPNEAVQKKRTVRCTRFLDLPGCPDPVHTVHMYKHSELPDTVFWSPRTHTIVNNTSKSWH